MHAWADKAARRVAAAKGRPGDRMYIESIKRNWRTEGDPETGLCRYDELAGYQAAGVPMEQAIAKLFRVDDASTAVSHPPECECRGEGIIPVVEERHGVTVEAFSPCPGRMTA